MGLGRSFCVFIGFRLLLSWLVKLWLIVGAAICNSNQLVLVKPQHFCMRGRKTPQSTEMSPPGKNSKAASKSVFSKRIRRRLALPSSLFTARLSSTRAQLPAGCHSQSRRAFVPGGMYWMPPSRTGDQPFAISAVRATRRVGGCVNSTSIPAELPIAVVFFRP